MIISHIQTHTKTLISNPAIDFILDEFKDIKPSNQVNKFTQNAPKTADPIETELSNIQISHQWPEWVVLMKKLIKNGYFDGVGNPFCSGGLADGKNCNQIRTACLNFARDRPNLMRYIMLLRVVGLQGFLCTPTV